MRRAWFGCLIVLLSWQAGILYVMAAAARSAAGMNANAVNGRLTVTVTGLESDAGAGHFALFDSSTAYDAGLMARKAVRGITNGVSVWKISELPAGDYVVTFFHDVNANNRLDRTGPGIPVEPLAFSNDVRPRFGPPRYDRMEFPFNGDEETLDMEAFAMLGRRGRFGIGVGMIVNQSPYERDGVRMITIPALTYVGSRVSLLGPSMQFRLGAIGPADARLGVRYSFDRFDKDNARLAGLQRRSDTIMAGGGLRFSLPESMTLDLMAETDLLGKHGGQRATAGLSRTWRLGGVNISPSAGAEWLSSQTAAHRYGVSETESRDLRPAYRTGATLSGNLGLGMQYTFGDATALILNGSLTLLDPAIQDSPIVVRDTLLSVFVALAYSL